ncbi:MAG TPA: hypothetical protein VGG22_08540 [Candidatus Baltobacteraceae bacterium]|jgi:hypothetical protein
MSSIAFALPVASGKNGADARKFVEALLHDESGHFKRRMLARGYKRFQVFHQQWPVELFVVYAESDDIHTTLKGHDEDDDFEKWFDKQYEELTGHHPERVAAHISELVMDWHPTKGGSKTHHH